MGAVDGFGLLQVEAGRVPEDVGDVELLHQLVHREDVLIGGQAPAEEGEVVEQAFPDEPALAVEEEVRLGVPLRKLLVPLPHHVGEVPEERHVARHADVDQRTVESHLPWSGGQQVLSPQDVGDAHQGIVHGIDQRIEGGAVGTDDGEIGDASGAEGNLAAHQVGEGDVLVRHAQPQDGLATPAAQRRTLLGGEVPIEVVVPELDVTAGSTVTLLDLFGGGERFIQVAGLDQPGDDVRVQLAAL